MKDSMLGVVCAGIALAIGTATPAAAASLSGGYNLGAVNITCAAQGQGSGSITEASTGCFDYVRSGSFQLSGFGQASHDTLRASASINLSALDPSPFIGTGSLIGNALAGAKYTDTLTIDIAGRTGELVDLVFETAMHGTMSAVADFDYVYGQADAVLQAIVNGTRLSVSRNAKSAGDSVSNDFNPGRVQIQLGTPFAVSAELSVKARLQRTSGNIQFFSGDVFSNFSSTAGITSFMLFELGEGGALIPEWNLGSESGQFGFYSAVPIPATVWLLAPALGLLAARVKRKAKA